MQSAVPKGDGGMVAVLGSEIEKIEKIIEENKKLGETISRDAFGHIELDKLNAGIWFADQFGKKLNARKILVQKSGYFGRSAKANTKDLDLIFKVADYAVSSAISGISGLVGWDEDNSNKLSCINFNRIKGGKPFDTSLSWYTKMTQEIKAI